MSERIEVKPNDSSWIGKKITLTGWSGYLVVKYVGDENLIGDDEHGNENYLQFWNHSQAACRPDLHLYESPQPTPPSNEWPCEPDCGSIVWGNGGWEYSGYIIKTLVHESHNFCIKCGSKRPAEAQKQEEKEEPKAVWMSPVLMEVPYNIQQKDEDKKPCISNGLFDSEKIALSLHGAISWPLTVKIEHQIKKVESIQIHTGLQPLELVAFKRINMLVDAVNALIQGEGVLKVKVQK